MALGRLGRWLVGVSLLLGGVAQASTEQWQAYEYNNFTGGLNENEPTTLQSNEASDLQNVVFTVAGAIEKRPFFAPLNDDATCGGQAATGGYMYKQADGDRFLIIVCGNDTIQRMLYGSGSSGPTGHWASITGALSFDVSNSIYSDFATVHDTAVIEDGLGTTPPYLWTGTGNATALSGSPANASMVEFHKNHLWLAGNTAQPTVVYFSNLDNIDVWTTTDFIAVGQDDGQPITALRSSLDCLYVFKSHSIWRICGTNRDDFTLEEMVHGTGASNNQSVAQINNQFVFYTYDGQVAVYDGGITIQIISGKIPTTLGAVEPTRLRNAVATSFDDGHGDEDFYLSLTDAGDTQNSIVLVFDTLHKAWTKFAGVHANALFPFELGDGHPSLAFATYEGILNKYPTTHANAQMSNQAFYKSGISNLGIPQQKTIHEAQVLVRQESTTPTISFEPRLDFISSGIKSSISLAGSSDKYDSAIYDTSHYADLTTTLDDVEIGQTGNYFQWYVENTNDREPFLLRAVRVWSEATGRVEGTQ